MGARRLGGRRGRSSSLGSALDRFLIGDVAGQRPDRAPFTLKAPRRAVGAARRFGAIAIGYQPPGDFVSIGERNRRMKRSLLMSGLVAGLILAVTALASPASASSGPRFPATVNLPNGWAPEGITAGRGTTVYVGSLANGAVWRGDVKTGTGSVLVPGVTGRVAVGTEYDQRNHRIWVAGGPTGAVRVYDARSGALLETYLFPAGFLNDLVVTRDAVYVTDSFNQLLWVIPLGNAGSLPAPDDTTSLPLTGDIHFVPGQFNANGIVATAKYLVLVQSNTGQLFRVDPKTGLAREVELGPGVSVAFGDGLELQGRTLYVVQNQLNQVAVFRLQDRLTSAKLLGTLTSGELDIPTTAAFVAGRLWAVNARFGTPVTPQTEYSIVRLPARP
jgi:sugar lactone lactonase YvrE